MRVADLAKELNVSIETILTKLKAFKMKAKDGNQELSGAAVTVLRGELRSAPKMAPAKAEAPAPKETKTPAKEIKAPAQEAKAKTAKTAAKEANPAKEKKTTAKTEAKKAPAKKKEEEPKKEKAAVKKAAAPKTAAPEVKKEEPAKTAVPPPPPPPAPAKPAVVIKEVPRSFISSEPFVTLKPLAKKKRRHDTGYHGHPSETAEKADVPAAGQPAARAEAAETDVSKLQILEVKLPITVKDLAVKLQQKPSVVLKQLMQMGILTNINQSLEEDIVRKLAVDFGFNLTEIKTQEQQLIEVHQQEQDDPKTLKARAPVVTFMGHVDHGKTSLLDRIRKSKIADSEHGGITQHIGAYSVQLPKGRITFLDTPGHEAFTAMRARGAHITDLVVIVIAADEGIMPQTEEALNHAQAAGVPIVIALNKIDKKTADPERVKKQLSERNLLPEDWGGKTIVVGVSATTGEGIDQLLEMILLEAELLELKANPDKMASGIIVEARMSKGRGSVVDLIVQSGTLHEGDIVVVGPHYGRVKAMLDDHERAIKEAGPSRPVEVLGLPAVPDAGEPFYVLDDEKLAREITSKRAEQIKNQKLNLSAQKLTLEDLYAQIQEGNIKEVNVIIKADVQGSLEALKDSLGKIPSNEIRIRFIHFGVGDVNLSDVLLGAVSKAIIIAFHVGIDPRAEQELEKNPVEIRQYRIIYDAVNDIRNAVEGLLEPKTKKKFAARVEVRQMFKLSKHGVVAGCYVQKGKVKRKDHVDVVRNGEVVHTSTLSSLKRFKDDVREVTEGMECGVTVQGFLDLQVGDVLEIYELEQIQRKLESATSA